MSGFSQIANSVPPVLSPFNAKKGEDFFGVQAKLGVGKSNDKYEAEADSMADKVVSNKQNNASTSFFNAAPIVQKNQGTEVKKEEQTENEIQQKPLAESITPVQSLPVQKCDCEKENKDNTIQKKPLAASISPVQQFQSIQKCDCENENVQKKEEDGAQTETTANPDFENKLNSSKGGGDALSKDTKAEMESGFGTDFSNVRIHNDATAVQMSQEIGAQAFASGNDIYFNEGKYNPDSASGKHLLAHELTHTVQQTGTIQRKMGDGHDLKSPRFSGEPKLESAFDDESYVQIGSRGDQVSKIQQALEDSGNPLPKYGVDGIFGPETQASVRSYQDKNHLSVDGIVGPETMGSLDEHFSKPQPKIPPVHPHVCEILQDDSKNDESKKTLFPLNTLSPDLKKAADGAPTVELPNGEQAIKCKIPPKEKKCTELCGCPLPSEPTGPEIKVGDVCKPKKHSVFVGESCPDEKDVLKVIEIQDNSGKFKLKSTSSDNDWLKVKICEGPHKGQVKQIQQRFVEQVQNFSLNITGPKTVEKSKSIKLKANGLPTTLTPKWEIKQTDKGEAKIIGPDSVPEIEVEGKTESGKKEDIIVSVTACDDSTSHKITVDPVAPVVPKFVPPTGPCTPFPVDLMRLPGVMRVKGMNEGATLMENWFIGASSIAPSYGKSDSTTITKTFLNGFSKYTDKIDEMLKDKTYMNDLAKDEIRSVLTKRGLNKPGSVFDMSLNPITFDSKGFAVQHGVIQSAGPADAITGLSFALGEFTVKLGIEGKVIQHIVSTMPLITKSVVVIEKVGFYVRDSFDFNDGIIPQPLGFWNVCTNDVGKGPIGDKHLVMNKDFRDWRGVHSKGEDAMVFSNDWDIRTLPSIEHFDF